jgi:hypothetical protein
MSLRLAALEVSSGYIILDGVLAFISNAYIPYTTSYISRMYRMLECSVQVLRFTMNDYAQNGQLDPI